jgi:hypothetical protein
MKFRLSSLIFPASILLVLLTILLIFEATMLQCEVNPEALILTLARRYNIDLNLLYKRVETTTEDTDSMHMRQPIRFG